MVKRMIEECDECGREFGTFGTQGGKESQKTEKTIVIDSTEEVLPEDEGRCDMTLATIKTKGDVCNECLKDALLAHLRPLFCASNWTDPK